MNTFLPYPDFVESVGALSNEDLWDQCQDVLHAMNILNQITESEVWQEHPVIRMWRGHEVSLCEFGIIACEELRARSGPKNLFQEKIEQHLEWSTSGDFKMEKPVWFGDMALHRSHMSNLIRRDPEHYTQKFPGVPNDLAYIWPVAE